MIIVKSPREIALMRTASKIVAEIHARLKEKLAPGMTTLDLDRMAEEWTKELGAVPAFKGYRGYQHTLCISVNEVVVHGIPSEKKVLKEGDIVGLDMGVIYKGWYGDAARTWPVGKVHDEATRLMDVTEKSLMAGIEAIAPGAYIGDIGHAVQTVAEGAGYSVVRDFVGHGIGRKLHEDPQVPNYGRQGKGDRLRVGMVLAIEPMINAGKPDVYIASDGWTALTVDGSLSAHFEHSVAVTEQGHEILSVL
ncbi:MAG TPA: type I methionyl aminopeptidase [bacterium]|nr:type I methionyl aminopeptidase [bacterium]